MKNKTDETFEIQFKTYTREETGSHALHLEPRWKLVKDLCNETEPITEQAQNGSKHVKAVLFGVKLLQ